MKFELTEQKITIISNVKKNRHPNYDQFYLVGLFLNVKIFTQNIMVRKNN